ncbi:MAG TPA: hypothetical protein VEW42_01050, partial [Candidatus Eisenbacteria bacterium]|nr:hypothetical protein [Candidatus Eisenbacteria bacterium]
MQEDNVHISLEEMPRNIWHEKLSIFWQKFSSQKLYAKISLLFLFAVILVAPIIVAQKTNVFSHADNSKSSETSTISTVNANAIQIIKNSLDSVVSSDPLSHTDQQRPYNDTPYYAMNLAKGSLFFKTIDPTRSQKYKNYAVRIADYFVAHKDDNNDGKVGWGLPYAWDAFQDGTTTNPSTNPANTVYAFQDGLVGNALLDVYEATGNSIYLQTVNQELQDYLPNSKSTIDTACGNCLYFYYSASPYDAGRLVKNTNVLMGLVAARAGKVNNNANFTGLAQKIYNTELYEFQQRNNYKYLGYDDKKYNTTSNPLDAHIVLETWSFAEIGKLLQNPQSSVIATLLSTFRACGAACQANTQSIYTDFTDCYWATALSFDKCSTVIDSYTSPQRNMSAFPLLALINFVELVAL